MIPGVMGIRLTSPGPGLTLSPATSLSPHEMLARALCARTTISLKNNFTRHFSAQNASDLIPVHPGLVLTLAVTDYLFRHCFKRGRLIADVPGISRHVLKSNLEIHIGLIR